jgi:solute carrier family 25 phosphate transporter 3
VGTVLCVGKSNLSLAYVFQGLFKFGLYEIFKVLYADLLGEENAYVWRTSLYLAASASAEFFADIALSPMEAIKVCLLSDMFRLMSLIECDTGLYVEV